MLPSRFKNHGNGGAAPISCAAQAGAHHLAKQGWFVMAGVCGPQKPHPSQPFHREAEGY